MLAWLAGAVRPNSKMLFLPELPRRESAYVPQLRRTLDSCKSITAITTEYSTRTVFSQNHLARLGQIRTTHKVDVGQVGTVLCQRYDARVRQQFAVKKGDDGQVGTVLCECHRTRVRQLRTPRKSDIGQMWTVSCRRQHARISQMLTPRKVDVGQVLTVLCQCHKACVRQSFAATKTTLVRWGQCSASTTTLVSVKKLQ